MNQKKQECNLIERMLSLLNLLQTNHVEICQLVEGRLETPLSDTEDFQMVCEMIKFMDEIPGGFLIYQAEQEEKIIYANKGLLRIFQCNTMAEFQELTGNSFRGMVHPQDVDNVEKSIWKQIQENQYDLDYVEYRVKRKDGQIRWLEDYGHYIDSETLGGIFYVFLGDATERWNRWREEKESFRKQQAEKEWHMQSLIRQHDKERALDRREQMRRMEIIEGLSINYDSILYADLEKDEVRPYRLSTRTGVLFGGEMLHIGTFSTYVKEYVETWVYPEDRELVEKMTDPDYIREHLAENKTYYINYRVIEDGSVKYMKLRIVDVSKDGNVQAVFGYRKVDEEQRQEEEKKKILAEALNNANSAIEAKNTFLSNVSHDMRTPLNSILGLAALAKRDIRDEEAMRGYLDSLEAAGKQLLSLIDEVLEISWTESNGVHAEEKEIDISAVLKEIYGFLRPQAVEKNIDFQMDMAGVTHRLVYSDYEKLRQMLLYLANNAVTYTKHGGSVSITARELAGAPKHFATYQFTITDTGVGISAEFLERIFEPFVRERNTTLSGIHGVGLGLTIAKNIVDMLGGSITAQSEVGKGSTFTVTLRFRIHEGDGRPEEAGARDAGDIQLLGKRILLAEDNELNMEIEKALLEELGFVVEPAEDGKIALEKIRQSKPGEYDLILMDIQMPVMDGWEAARAIRRLADPQLANIPIIAFSANVFEQDIRTSMESGMNAHLRKPIDIPLMMKTIGEVLQK